MEIVPHRRPAQHPEYTAKKLLSVGVRDAVALLGVRGYYRDSLGYVGSNDRGLYDDAIFISSPSCHAAFNANTDPSESRKGVASLACGVWRFEMSIHGKSRAKELQYPCLEQSQPVKVIRDGTGEDVGMFAIQIHRGSKASTSSLGCQTIWPDQYDSFIAILKDQMARYKQKEIPYLLTEYQG